jgi:hypothetical protein
MTFAYGGVQYQLTRRPRDPPRHVQVALQHMGRPVPLAAPHLAANPRIVAYFNNPPAPVNATQAQQRPVSLASAPATIPKNPNLSAPEAPSSPVQTRLLPRLLPPATQAAGATFPNLRASRIPTLAAHSVTARKSLKRLASDRDLDEDTQPSTPAPKVSMTQEWDMLNTNEGQNANSMLYRGMRMQRQQPVNARQSFRPQNTLVQLQGMPNTMQGRPFGYMESPLALTTSHLPRQNMTNTMQRPQMAYMQPFMGAAGPSMSYPGMVNMMQPHYQMTSMNSMPHLPNMGLHLERNSNIFLQTEHDFSQSRARNTFGGYHNGSYTQVSEPNHQPWLLQQAHNPFQPESNTYAQHYHMHHNYATRDLGFQGLARPNVHHDFFTRQDPIARNVPSAEWTMTGPSYTQLQQALSPLRFSGTTRDDSPGLDPDSVSEDESDEGSDLSEDESDEGSTHSDSEDN